MDWHRYPDPGGIDSDRERLQFAVGFATAQRARTAQRTYDAANSAESVEDLIFLAVDAFEEKMQAVEDTLGWLWALDQWIPEGRNLFPLLDAVRLGRDEARLVALVDRLDEDGLRRILRARREDIEAADLPDGTSQRIDESIPAILGGLVRLADFRTANGRRTARMYNKSKHMLQAVLRSGPDGTHAVDFISGAPAETVGRIVATSANVHAVAAETILQAVLHEMLATILMLHYGERYESPLWVTVALDLREGWHDDAEVARLVRAV